MLHYSNLSSSKVFEVGFGEELFRKKVFPENSIELTLS